MGFNEERIEIFQNHQTWLFSCRMRLKSYYCSRNVKTFKIWEFRGKIMFFLKNTLKNFRSTKLAKFFLDCVSDCPIAEELLKRSKVRIFGEN